MARNRGKRYRAAFDEIDRTHAYPPAEAISLVKETAEGTKFDRRSRSTCGSGSTSATPRSSCAARWRCRTGSASRSPSPSSPRATPPAPRQEAGADFVGAQDLA